MTLRCVPAEPRRARNAAGLAAGGAVRGLLLVTWLAALALALPAGAAAPAPAAPELGTAIARGLAWQAAHPATPDDGGLADILDEGVGYYVRRNLAVDAAERERSDALLRSHMARLGGLPEFEQWVYRGGKSLTDYYHLVLAARLLRFTGEPSELEGEITAQARGVLQRAQHCDPTKRLAIALFLQHLGADPGIPLAPALAMSRIERITRGGAPALPARTAPAAARTAGALELYALVHEIVALTDFGRLPPPHWLAQRRAAISRYLAVAAPWAVSAGNIDLAAELLMSARLLEVPLGDPYSEVVAAIVAGQQPDGSWGEQETRRADRRRHAVLTATTALWVYLQASAAARER